MATIKIVPYKSEEEGIPKYHDDNAYECLVNYVFNPEKTRNYIGAWGVHVSNAAYAMKLLTHIYHQDTPESPRLRHWIVSFTQKELDYLVNLFSKPIPEILFQIGMCLTGHYRNNYQIIYGVHWYQEEHPHIHIVMNTTCFWDGHKYHCDRNEYYSWQQAVRWRLKLFGLQTWVIKDKTDKTLELSDGSEPY